MMITQRTLHSDSDFTAYVLAYENAGGFPVDIDYLRSSDVTGFFRQGEMVGGFVINDGQALRCLQNMPAETAQQLAAEFGETRRYEIMCVWMIRAIRRTPDGINAWLRILCKTLVARHSQRLVTCAVNDGMRRLYIKSGLEVTYTGKIDLADGSRCPKYIMTTPNASAPLRFAVTEIFRRSSKVIRARFLGAAKVKRQENPVAVGLS